MARQCPQVEPVAQTDPAETTGQEKRRRGAVRGPRWQMALLAARAGALACELERERRRRQRVLERYERLLAERDAEIERLQREGTDEGRSLLAQLPVSPGRRG